ncbi:hypothetical protein Agub_g9118, partial [Astrephomene gubernaculifera]
MRNSDLYADAIYATAYAARLCPDVLLRAFGTSYPVHRIILASQSAYFATLLRWVSWSAPREAGGQECLPSHDLVLGEEVTQRGFEWLLEYFYGSPLLALTPDNVFDVLASAHYLGATRVQSACVDFLAQHLDPTNFAACLTWATGADHGAASDMLAAACRLVLSLQLPRNLPAWAPALPLIEPPVLLDILSSDHLAVHSEYGRYELVREVAGLLLPGEGEGGAAAAANGGGGGGVAEAEVAVEEAAVARSASWSLPSSSAGMDGSGAGGGGTGGGARSGGCGRGAAATAAACKDGGGGASPLQRLLGAALHLPDQPAITRHLHLARSCPAAIPCSSSTTTAAVVRAAGGGAAGEDGGLGSSGRKAVSSNNISPAAASGMGMAGSPGSSTTTTCDGPSSGGSQGWSNSSSGSSARVSFGSTTASETEGPAAAAAAAAAAPGSNANTLAETPTTPSSVPAAAAASPDAGSVPAAATAAAAAAAACARLLLHEAVRYEHLTVPQLMAVQAEGRVPQQLLQAALWERARL